MQMKVICCGAIRARVTEADTLELKHPHSKQIQSVRQSRLTADPLMDRGGLLHGEGGERQEKNGSATATL